MFSQPLALDRGAATAATKEKQWPRGASPGPGLRGAQRPPRGLRGRAGAGAATGGSMSPTMNRASGTKAPIRRRLPTRRSSGRAKLCTPADALQGSRRNVGHRDVQYSAAFCAARGAARIASAHCALLLDRRVHACLAPTVGPAEATAVADVLAGSADPVTGLAASQCPRHIELCGFAVHGLSPACSLRSQRS